MTSPLPPRVIRLDLPTPDAVIVETERGRVYVVADHRVPAAELDALTAAARVLPGIARTVGEPAPR